MEGSAHQFVGPEPALGVSRQNIRQKIKCWIVNQPVILWEGRTSTQSQVRGLMSGPCLAAKINYYRLIECNPGWLLSS